MAEDETYLVIYKDRSEFHRNEVVIKYAEGIQSAKAEERYKLIIQKLEDGYLDEMYKTLEKADFSELNEKCKKLLQKLADGINSKYGRAIAGLTFLQLTVKSIAPEQNIRLHKGNKSRGQFSWQEGISMRIIDKNFTNKFLREYDLIKLNADGIFMTRSLAENYPYTELYKAKIQGPFKQCLEIVDALEDGDLSPEIGLKYFTYLLKKKNEDFKKLVEEATQATLEFKDATYEKIFDLLVRFFDNSASSARAYEIVMHGFMQAMEEAGYLDEEELSPLSQMRNANKKHGNVGDVELKINGVISEAWDAKYRKQNLELELEELNDKIAESPGLQVAGFVVDSNIDRRDSVVRRAAEIEEDTGVSIKLFNFDEWVDYQLSRADGILKKKIAFKWLNAVVESLSQKRRNIAPIDEPCDTWLNEIIKLMKEG